MSNLAAGNVLGSLSSNPRNASTAIPGYLLCKATGYIALKTSLDSRFTILEAPSNQGDPEMPLSLPWVAKIYGVGYEAGPGCYNEGNGDYLHLGLVQGGIPASSVNMSFCSIKGSALTEVNPGVPLPPQNHPTGRIDGAIFASATDGGPLKDYQHSAIFLSNPIASDNTFAVAINNALASVNNNLGVPPKLQRRPGETIEIQIRDAFGPTAALAVAPGHGLRQNPNAIYKNQGYMIVDIYYVIRDWRVSSAENLDVHWEDVFKYVF